MKLRPFIHVVAIAASVCSLLVASAGGTSAAYNDTVQPAAASCTGWSSNSTPPPTVRVLRVGTGVVETVDLEHYTKIVMAAEFNKTWPIETLRAGAIATKEYAWYYAIHYRGGTKNGVCYDVQDNSTDQDYWPESRSPSSSQINAVESTWGESVLRSGAIFLTGYRAGSSTTCGADKDGYHLMQLSARGCGLLGHSAEYILQLYYTSTSIQGGPVAPGAPTGAVAVPYDTSAQVSWTAPSSDGGREVTGYTVTSDPDVKTCTTTGALTCAVSGLTNSASYTFTVTATNRIGTGPASDPSAAISPAVVPGSTFNPITPVRLLDTRNGNGSSGKIAANTPRTFQIGGRDVIPADATAVTGNLTVTGETNSWAVYLGPDPVAYPASSTINFKKGDVTANGVTVALSATGSLSATYMASSGNKTDLVFDVTGYFMANTAGQTYHPIAPARIVDSRKAQGIGHKLAANTPATFTVRGHGDVPDDATAVTGNVTVVNSTNSWAVYLGPTPVAKPSSSTLNFAKGQVQANNLTVALSATGTLSATYMSSAGNTTDLVFDVTGFYTADLTGGTYVPITPIRLLDSRSGNGLSSKLAANSPRAVQITGRGIPSDAAGITANLTVTNETNGWAVFVGPDAEASPTSSTLNFVTGDVKANGLTVALDGSGAIHATYMSKTGNTTHLVLDVTGYFRGP
jgi:hypothetical protein